MRPMLRTVALQLAIEEHVDLPMWSHNANCWSIVPVCARGRGARLCAQAIALGTLRAWLLIPGGSRPRFPRGEIIPEQWATSSRNGGRNYLGVAYRLEGASVG